MRAGGFREFLLGDGGKMMVGYGGDGGEVLLGGDNGRELRFFREEKGGSCGEFVVLLGLSIVRFFFCFVGKRMLVGSSG